MPLTEQGFKLTGLKEVTSDLEKLGLDVGQASLDAVDRAGQILEDSIKRNFHTMFHRKYATGAMENSIGHTAKREGNNAFGTAGVFKIDHVMIAHGHDEKHAISRPQLAYWYEMGIQPHSTSSGSKVARDKGQDTQMTSGIAPKPFISAAYDANVEKIIRDMSSTLSSYMTNKGF